MDPEFPADCSISIELKDLILQMLAKDPEHRATIYNIYHHPWYKGKQFENTKYKSLNMDVGLKEKTEAEQFETKEKSAKQNRVKFVEPPKTPQMPSYMKPTQKQVKLLGIGANRSKAKPQSNNH